MVIERHIIISLSLGAGVWFYTRSVLAAVLCFATGTLADIDHIIEHGVNFGWDNINYRVIKEACVKTPRLEPGGYTSFYLIFHSNEVAILFFVAYLVTRNIYLLALAAGYGAHMIMDSTGNKAKPLTYFMIWRALNRFETRKFFSTGGIK
jgi:hypothetical protein